MSYQRIRSKYDGTCGECLQPYRNGDSIWYERGNYCMCDSCGNRYAANYNRQHTAVTAVTPTPSSPPPETREQAIERMHDEKMAMLRVIAEQISMVADKEQKRNEYLEAEAKKGKGSQ